MTQKEIQHARIRAELERTGVTIEELPGGAMRLHGMFGNVILLHDLTNLSSKEIRRLTGE